MSHENHKQHQIFNVFDVLACYITTSRHMRVNIFLRFSAMYVCQVCFTCNYTYYVQILYVIYVSIVVRTQMINLLLIKNNFLSQSGQFCEFCHSAKMRSLC